MHRRTLTCLSWSLSVLWLSFHRAVADPTATTEGFGTPIDASDVAKRFSGVSNYDTFDFGTSDVIFVGLGNGATGFRGWTEGGLRPGTNATLRFGSIVAAADGATPASPIPSARTINWQIMFHTVAAIPGPAVLIRNSTFAKPNVTVQIPVFEHTPHLLSGTVQPTGACVDTVSGTVAGATIHPFVPDANAATEPRIRRLHCVYEISFDLTQVLNLNVTSNTTRQPFHHEIAGMDAVLSLRSYHFNFLTPAFVTSASVLAPHHNVPIFLFDDRMNVNAPTPSIEVVVRDGVGGTCDRSITVTVCAPAIGMEPSSPMTSAASQMNPRVQLCVKSGGFCFLDISDPLGSRSRFPYESVTADRPCVHFNLTALMPFSEWWGRSDITIKAQSVLVGPEQHMARDHTVLGPVVLNASDIFSGQPRAYCWSAAHAGASVTELNLASGGISLTCDVGFAISSNNSLAGVSGGIAGAITQVNLVRCDHDVRPGIPTIDRTRYTTTAPDRSTDSTFQFANTNTEHCTIASSLVAGVDFIAASPHNATTSTELVQKVTILNLPNASSLPDGGLYRLAFAAPSAYPNQTATTGCLRVVIETSTPPVHPVVFDVMEDHLNVSLVHNTSIIGGCSDVATNDILAPTNTTIVTVHTTAISTTPGGPNLDATIRLRPEVCGQSISLDVSPFSSRPDLMDRSFVYVAPGHDGRGVVDLRSRGTVITVKVHSKAHILIDDAIELSPETMATYDDLHKVAKVCSVVLLLGVPLLWFGLGVVIVISRD